MDDIIEVCPKKIRSILSNDEDLKKLFHLIKKLDSLPQVIKQSKLDSRCLYEAVSKGLSVNFLEQNIGDFFLLQKPAGAKLPLKLRFNKTVRMLGGIRKNQSLFLKKTSVGEIYGALWPWQSDLQNITILIGFNREKINNDDYQELQKLVDSICTTMS